MLSVFLQVDATLTQVGGLSGYFIPFATESFGTLPSLNADKYVRQLHSLLLTDISFMQFCSLFLEMSTNCVISNLTCISHHASPKCR